ncbi:heparanase-like protein 1 isoform X1 [Salvia splendens]|uniref:heparanase-like protein 1 isoform X1 n=1 Tax=Salvia splendens TaxID=180675 RepID=UPI001C2749BB|nr:heparanase-like protein 1 isoform X1 [Salvia splendens]
MSIFFSCVFSCFLKLALFLVFLAFCSAILAQESIDARISIDTSSTIANTDANYICATIDWWPKDKCEYNRCPWGSSSVLNLNLSHPSLINAIQAFKNLRIRVGGSLQDQVVYEVGNLSSSCQPFTKQKGGLFGFSKGCLPMRRWDELNQFFKKTGVVLTFGLNALYGRYQLRKGVCGGDWDPSNAHDFIRYTISKGYNVDSWEFGNELSGKGVGASVSAQQYGKDLVRLNTMVDELYASNAMPKPTILAPGGFYDKSWFDTLLQVSGPNTVNVLSHHMYTLGAGNDPNIMKKILNPSHLDRASLTFGSLSATIQANGPWAAAWVGESGGAFNNGAKGISNAFINTFWYLDQLGMAAKLYNTDTPPCCRIAYRIRIRYRYATDTPSIRILGVSASWAVLGRETSDSIRILRRIRELGRIGPSSSSICKDLRFSSSKSTSISVEELRNFQFTNFNPIWEQNRQLIGYEEEEEERGGAAIASTRD